MSLLFECCQHRYVCVHFSFLFFNNLVIKKFWILGGLTMGEVKPPFQAVYSEDLYIFPKLWHNEIALQHPTTGFFSRAILNKTGQISTRMMVWFLLPSFHNLIPAIWANSWPSTMELIGHNFTGNFRTDSRGELWPLCFHCCQTPFKNSYGYSPMLLYMVITNYKLSIDLIFLTCILVSDLMLCIY